MTNSMSAPAVNATAAPATSARISSANAGGACGGARPLRMDLHAISKVVAFGLSIGTSSRQRLSLMSEAAAISKRHQPRCLCRRAFVYAAPVGSSPVRQSVNIFGWMYHLRVQKRRWSAGGREQPTKGAKRAPMSRVRAGLRTC